jgi:hypothetical protein
VVGVGIQNTPLIGQKWSTKIRIKDSSRSQQVKERSIHLVREIHVPQIREDGSEIIDFDESNPIKYLGGFVPHA